MFVKFTYFVLTRFNVGDSDGRSGLQRGVGMRRRAEVVADGNGGGGSGAVHWASCHPSVKG